MISEAEDAADVVYGRRNDASGRPRRVAARGDRFTDRCGATTDWRAATLYRPFRFVRDTPTQPLCST